MKTYFEDPILRMIRFEAKDVLTASPENPDDENPGGETPIIGNP